jgi:hypothetical protein
MLDAPQEVPNMRNILQPPFSPRIQARPEGKQDARVGWAAPSHGPLVLHAEPQPQHKVVGRGFAASAVQSPRHSSVQNTVIFSFFRLQKSFIVMPPRSAREKVGKTRTTFTVLSIL